MPKKPTRSNAYIRPIKRLQKEDKLGIIILCGGDSNRMKMYIPRPSIEISPNQTIIGRQINIYRNMFPEADIVVVTGYERHILHQKLPRDIRVVENENFDKYGINKSIYLGLMASPNKAILLVHGDIVFSKQAIPVVDTTSKMVIDETKQLSSTEIGINYQNDKVLNFSYSFNNKWAKIAYLVGYELDVCRDLLNKKEKHEQFEWQLFNEIIDNQGNFQCYFPDNLQIVDVDTSRDISRAKEIENENSY